MFYLGRKYSVRFDPRLTVTGQTLVAIFENIKLMKTVLLYLSFIFFLTSCDIKVTYNVDKIKNYTDNFESSLISQFPKEMECNNYTITSNGNTKKNDVGLLLYLYGVSENSVLTEKNKAKKLALAKYATKDKCLLIVNRFETIDTYENRKVVDIIDSTNVNLDCYKKQYPIPNFIDYENRKNNDLKLDNDFDIYVLEANAGNYFSKFDLSPNFQMPEKWRNGYSKGIAINESKKIIIYWSVIW